MSDDPYVYPGTRLLKNRFDIRDSDALNRIERRLAVQRQRQGVPAGDFDLAHLQTIHRHMFQDIYEWAGQVRTVNISKGGSQFMPHQMIEAGMADVHRRVVEAGYLANLAPADFARAAGSIISDVNHVHPFRDGNGRTQLHYLDQLARHAGHTIDLKRLDPARWIDASREANRKNDAPMAERIKDAMVDRNRQRHQDRQEPVSQGSAPAQAFDPPPAVPDRSDARQWRGTQETTSRAERDRDDRGR